MKKENKRFSYSCVGYGVFSLLGEYYRMGRIEIFDSENESGFAVDEGTFCLPLEVSYKIEEMFDNLQTDFPINIKIGSVQWCTEEVSKKLNIPVDKLNDPDTKEEFYTKKKSMK